MPENISTSIPGNITLPPAEIRSVIEKTAGYVSRNGEQFEQRIKQKEASNTKFQFLNKDDPYYEYYAYHLKLIKDGLVSKNGSNMQSTPSVSTGAKLSSIESDTNQIPTPPPLKHLITNPYISQLDLSMIKLAAQLVAIKGDSYQGKLIEQTNRNKEQRIQFQFLDPGHSLHSTYLKYLDSYKEILSNRQEIVKKLENVETNKNFTLQLLDSCYARAEYETKQDQSTNELESQIEKDRLEFASIDWSDFAVVEVVEFNELDNVAQLGEPLTKAELESRSLLMKSSGVLKLVEAVPHDYESDNDLQGEAADNDDDDDEEIGVPTYEDGSDDNDSKDRSSKPQLVVPKGMKIRAAGESRIKRSHQSAGGFTGIPTEKLLRCPITSQMIPESRFQRHLSILLRDPKYKEEKARYEAKVKFSVSDSNIIDGDEIFENIKRLAAVSSSSTNEEDERAGGDNKRQKVIWNGQAGSAGFTQREAKRMIDYDEVERQKAERLERENRIGPSRR